MKNVKLFISLTILSVLLMTACKKDNTNPTAPSGGNPAVATTGQANNSTNVPRNQAITVTFTKPMNAASINSSTFIVMQGTTAISGTITCSGSTATFYPSTSMQANVNYVVTVTTGAADQTGLALASNTSWNFTTGSTSATLAVVTMDTIRNYVIFAKNSIHNSGTSNVTGHVGLDSDTANLMGFAMSNGSVLGFSTSSQVTGNLYASNMTSQTTTHMNTAVNAMVNAYNDASNRLIVDFSEYSSGDISGKTLTAGLYRWSGNVTSTSNVTISGGPNDVWIFQVEGDLSLSSATNIILAGGAQAKNVFWQVKGQVTAAANSHLEGAFMAASNITLGSNATLTGCAYSQTSVIMDSDVVTKSN